jgi:hypothetical protein
VAFTRLRVTANAPIGTWTSDRRRSLSLEPLVDAGITLVLSSDFITTNPLEDLHERLQNAPRQPANLTVTSRVEQVLYGDAGKGRRKVYGERHLAP